MKRFVTTLAMVLLLFTSSAKAEQQIMPEALGYVLLTDMINTFYTINSMADLFEFGKQTKENINFVMTLEKNFIKDKSDYINKMINNNELVGEDVQFGYQIIEAYGYLNKQAYYLNLYAESRSQDAAKQFQYFRKKAKDLIGKLSGLDQ